MKYLENESEAGLVFDKTVCGNKFLSVGLDHRTPKENDAFGLK
jgi:hypothetical protein